ncbi:MAG: hypothetical protein M3N33_09390 [Actinomycetota bacterium]|nr:hypothetical protein [Actinomycetota bacterium]
MGPPKENSRRASAQTNPDAPPPDRYTSWLAWSLAGLSGAMFVGGCALTVLASPGVSGARASSDWGTAGAFGGLVLFLPFLAFPLVGALIASNRPRNPIGWICLTAGLFWMLIVLGNSIPAGSGLYPATISALTQWMWIPPVGLLGIYMILLFPDGRLPSRRWRPLAWLSGAVMVLASVAITVAPGPLPGYPGVRNPFGLEGHPMVTQALPGIIALLPVCILASAASLVWRYRHSGGEVRQQIKWVAFAASFVGLAYGITLVGGLFLAPEALTTEEGPLWMSLLQNVVLMSYAGIPVAVGFAVLRYRLYDIDILVNRTLVYVTLTAALALIYVVSVVSLQFAFRALTGQETQLAVVASTLVIAAVFGPLRRRVQAFVDRRFFRKKYDATKTLETFASTLRDETDLRQLNAGLLAVVRETLQPAHASLWLKPARVVSSTGEQDR